MNSFFAFLRGINVGGNKLLSMATLRQCLNDAGFGAVRTHLQSGNVLFQTQEDSSTNLEARLKGLIKQQFELDVEFFVRSRAELQAVVNANPFPSEALKDPSHLLVIFLSGEVDSKALEIFQAEWQGPEYFKAAGREVYAVFPAGIGESKLISSPGWKRLVGHGTGRNWNTITKLLTLAAS